MRFELTVPFDTTVFKTVAISQTRPHFHNLVDAVGVEPTVPGAGDLQSPGVTSFPTHPCLVAGGGIEPPSEAYETSELPLLYPAIVSSTTTGAR